jgi:hypothetical protein
MGQELRVPSHTLIQFSWKKCLQGNNLASSPIFQLSWQIGHSGYSFVYSGLILITGNSDTTLPLAGGAPNFNFRTHTSVSNPSTASIPDPTKPVTVFQIVLPKPVLGKVSGC